MPLQTTLGLAQAATRRLAAIQFSGMSLGLLRRWRERAYSSRQLCELDDHILRDIGLTRDEVLHEAARPFWR